MEFTDQCIRYRNAAGQKAVRGEADCLKVIPYTEPPYSTVLGHLAERGHGTGTRVACGPLPALVRSFAERLNITW
jgi:hypothetical protein